MVLTFIWGFDWKPTAIPFTLIDYIVVHELVHIKHKDHSKEFFKELGKFIPDWKVLAEKLYGMKL